MNKERLEEIKQRLVLLHNAVDVDDETKSYIFEYLKIEWLIERVQELENENRILRTVAKSNKYIGEQYLEQNKRYREAIQKARDELNRQSGAVNDLGQVNINKDLLQVFLILNKALESEE